LHSKNEENALNQQALSATHEKEMEMIIKQANDMILRQKDEIEKAKDNQAVKEQVKKME